MKRSFIIIISIIMFFDATAAFGWGSKGHDIVAAIAEQHLTPKAKRKIDKLLDGKSIIYFSSWMDNIQNSPYWENLTDNIRSSEKSSRDLMLSTGSQPSRQICTTVRAKMCSSLLRVKGSCYMPQPFHIQIYPLLPRKAS